MNELWGTQRIAVSELLSIAAMISDLPTVELILNRVEEILGIGVHKSGRPENDRAWNLADDQIEQAIRELRTRVDTWKRRSLKISE